MGTKVRKPDVTMNILGEGSSGPGGPSRSVAPPSPPSPPLPSVITSDDYWETSPSGTGGTAGVSTWNVAENRWETAIDDFTFRYALQPRTSGGEAGWEADKRPSSIRISINSGPSTVNTVAFSTNLTIYDTGGNTLGSQSFSQSAQNEDQTHDIVLDFSPNLDIARIVLECFVYSSGPNTFLIELIP